MIFTLFLVHLYGQMAKKLSVLTFMAEYDMQKWKGIIET